MKRNITLSLAIALMAFFNQVFGQDFTASLCGGDTLPISINQSADYPWVVGDSCVASSDIDGLKTSWFSATFEVTEEIGTLNFDYKVESAGWGEALYCVIDGADSLYVQQSTDWTAASYTLGKGEHTVMWKYILSGSYTTYRSYLRNLAITGINIDTPYMSISTHSVNFKNCTVGNDSTAVIPFTNTGNQDLTITSVSGLSAPFSVEYPTEAIAKGEEAEIKITFTPTEEDFWKQTLQITTNGNSRTIAVQGLCSETYAVEATGYGQLSSVVTDLECDSLTVWGYMNSSDFDFVQNKLPNLKYLNIKAVTVTDNMIPGSALSGKSSLVEVILPLGLTAIDTYAFNECTSLKTVAFPETLTSIGNHAFYNCAFEGELELPVNVRTIGKATFEYTDISKIILPDSLATIGNYAFSYCYKLEEVVFPEKLTSIGTNAFYDCYRLRSATLKGATPPSVGSNAFNYTQVFYVPEGSGATYSSASYWSGKVIIDGDTPKKVTVELTTAGTLGEELLKQVEYVSVINELVVSGPLNSDDYYQIQSRMPNLISIDMSGVTMENLPNEFFKGRTALLEVKLPATLKTIGEYAFYRCYGLTSMDIPEGVTSIGYGAFYDCFSLKEVCFPATLTTIERYAFYQNRSLTSIELPDGITLLNESVFQECTKLKHVKFPGNLKKINKYAFYSCSALSAIELPEGLTYIGYYAFCNCTSLKEISFPTTLTTLDYESFNKCYALTEITLPASLTYCYVPFKYCNNITKITVLASVPPTLGNNYDILYLVPKSGIELLVPFWSVETYKLAKGWDEFTIINPMDYETDVINIPGKLTISAEHRFTNQPTVNLWSTGNFTVRGTDPLSMKLFVQEHDMTNYKYYYNSNDNSQYSTLLSESGAMRADSVYYNIYTPEKRWMFVSLPFDVNVADITASDEALYVIRSYDGASRATGESANWKDVASDATLKAGQGYIIQANKNATLRLPAVNNDNKNRLFSGASLSQMLTEHAAEFGHNANWNFVGNPFPCYFDIYYMDYTAPLTIWNGRAYEAYSPQDDNYILRPMQAFFIQKPVDLAALNFQADGRQMDTSVRQHATTRSTGSGERMLVNLTFGNEEYTDKTRIVINPSASMAYELERDASKFMSDDSSVPQIFSLDSNGNRYAINERPIGQGVVSLGVYVGTETTHTLALGEGCEGLGEVILTDKLTGKQVRLDQESYTFSAEAGLYENRFDLTLQGILITGIGESATAEEGVKVTAAARTVQVTAPVGTEVQVCNLSGQVVERLLTSDTVTTVAMEPGIYIVSVGGKSYKVMVTK